MSTQLKQVKTLRRVKELREENLLMEVQKKKRQILEADELAHKKRALVDESLRTFAAREKKIYDKIMEKIVGVSVIEKVKEDIKSLQKEHQRLEDALMRALHVKRTLETELEKLRVAYNKAIIDRQKYVDLTKKLIKQIEIAQEYKEDEEREDTFSGISSMRRRRHVLH